MLWDKEKGNFPVRFIASPSVEFAGPLNIFVPFLVPTEKSHKTKFEMEEENTKLQIARKLHL